MSIDIKLHKDDLPEDLNLGNSVAIDGEFMGLNIKRDPLCLIQISTGNSDAYIIQLNRKTYKAPNLIKLLKNKKIKKLFHYARSDLSFIKHYLKTDVENIQCSKLKSRIGRTFTDKHGLKDLIKEFLDIDISKQKKNSDFGGKLSPSQLKYCANDVIYLHRIHEELDKILIRENRMKLYNDCIKFIKTRVDLDLADFKDDIWSH
jgi:ribonuclease D